MYYNCQSRPISQPDEDHSSREVDMDVVKRELKENLDHIEGLITDEWINLIDLSRLIEEVVYTSGFEAADYSKVGVEFTRIVNRAIEKYGEYHGS